MAVGRLIDSMLKNGERGSVAEYLERSAASRAPGDAARVRKEAAAIRAGRMPERYQRCCSTEGCNADPLNLSEERR